MQEEQEHNLSHHAPGQHAGELCDCSVQLIWEPCAKGTGQCDIDAGVFRRWKEAGVVVVVGMEKS